ncbi:ribosomal-protein-alanine N-acetyltransferase [Schaalia meyeri]|nr:ribosomal-protein-alanine N-acetyltransferase [Schaalia meyeri]
MPGSRMRGFFSRRARVWGRDVEVLTLRVADPVGRGFLRCGPDSNPHPRELVVRPVRGQEHRALDAVRRADGHWLRPWEATLPPDTLEHIPTFSQYVRRADCNQRDGTGLVFGVQVDGSYVGQFSLSNVHWGAMSSGMLGYWILSDWSGRGLGTLVTALILDLVVGELGLHRVEVCVRPENERSLGLCRGLGLVEEGLRPRYMHICGQWADHIAFFIDAETLPEGGLVQRRWGSPAIE